MRGFLHLTIVNGGKRMAIKVFTRTREFTFESGADWKIFKGTLTIRDSAKERIATFDKFMWDAVGQAVKVQTEDKLPLPPRMRVGGSAPINVTVPLPKG
jgi:hypothetical protein